MSRKYVSVTRVRQFEVDVEEIIVGAAPTGAAYVRDFTVIILLSLLLLLLLLLLLFISTVLIGIIWYIFVIIYL